MRYLRVYADADGESRFEDCEFETRPVDLVDGAPPAAFTDPMTSSEIQMFRLSPANWEDAAHPAPRKQLVIVLAGGIEIETSDGETRQLFAGDLLLAEDTDGKGHITRSVGGQELAVAWMPLTGDKEEQRHET